MNDRKEKGHVISHVPFPLTRVEVIWFYLKLFYERIRGRKIEPMINKNVIIIMTFPANVPKLMVQPIPYLFSMNREGSLGL